MSIVLLNGQNMTVISEHYGHSAKILGYGYCSTGPISIGLLSLGIIHIKYRKIKEWYGYIGRGILGEVKFLISRKN